MSLPRYFLLLALFFSIFVQAEAKPPLVASGNVKQVMNELFDYHIDQKEMNGQIMERALKIYIKQFDPSKSYLLHEEVVLYLNPSDQNLRKMVTDYEKDRFTTFFALNQKIQQSIERARGWRTAWEQNPHRLIADAKKIKEDKAGKSTKFALTLDDLQRRHYRKFLEFIALHLQEIKDDDPNMYVKVIALCERQLVHSENDYLGIDSDNRSLGAAEQEHLIVQRILKALANGLDSHTVYFSPDEAYAMKVQLEKGMCGIGVVLREGIEGIIIQDLINGGPAERSGKLHKGDVIVEVDGVSVRSSSFQKVLEQMKGEEGTQITLRVVRNDTAGDPTCQVRLMRSKIVLADQRVDVESEPFGDGIIGKITLHSFYEGDDGVSSEKDLKQAIENLRKEGPLYGLVLDMRDNTGGFLTQSVKVTGLFISSGVVVISKYSDQSMKYYRTLNEKRFYDGPLVVLISRGSASATEIVAQSLKDYGVAVVVGDTQTYGKGTIQHQTITNSKNPSFFKVTVGKYYSVSGKSTQIDGVKADIVVPTALNFDEIGEAYLDNPLPADKVEPAYHDSLADIDGMARKWFQKYYLPVLQRQEKCWEKMIPQLRANSKERLETSRNFQIFLTQIKEEIKPKGKLSYGHNDLQMDEAVNIVKDMVLLSGTQPEKH